MTKYIGWILVAIILLIIIFRDKIVSWFTHADGSPCIWNQGSTGVVGPAPGIYKDGKCVLPAATEGSACAIGGMAGIIVNGVCTPPSPGPSAQRLTPDNIIVPYYSRLPYYYRGCFYGNPVGYRRGWMQISKIQCS